jgi:hypothetical protein
MKLREELLAEPESKMELFLGPLAVNGHVAASTQNQAFIQKNEHRTFNFQREKCVDKACDIRTDPVNTGSEQLGHLQIDTKPPTWRNAFSIF